MDLRWVALARLVVDNELVLDGKGVFLLDDAGLALSDRETVFAHQRCDHIKQVFEAHVAVVEKLVTSTSLDRAHRFHHVGDGLGDFAGRTGDTHRRVNGLQVLLACLREAAVLALLIAQCDSALRDAAASSGLGQARAWDEGATGSVNVGHTAWLSSMTRVPGTVTPERTARLARSCTVARTSLPPAKNFRHSS